MTVKDVLNALPESKRREIFYAFNSNIAYQISLGDGRVLAVHSNNIPNFQVEIEAGNWAVGRFVNVNRKGKN